MGVSAGDAVCLGYGFRPTGGRQSGHGAAAQRSTALLTLRFKSLDAGGAVDAIRKLCSFRFLSQPVHLW